MKKFEDPLQNEFGTLSQKTGLKEFIWFFDWGFMFCNFDMVGRQLFQNS